jgi:hypothetical protein
MSNNHDWQSLVELSGLLVSEPLLNENFPDGPQPLPVWLSRRFRNEYERWQGAEDRREKNAEAADRARTRWIEFTLLRLLDYDESRLRGGMSLPPQLVIDLTDYMQTLKPNMALVDDNGNPQLLVYVANGALDRPEQVTGRWKASPFTKIDRLLRDTRVQLGIITNGTDWRLIYAAPGLPTSYITWTANGWNDERSTLQAFTMLLRSSARLIDMAAESQQRQADVTDQLGNQVLSALSIFVRELDRLDTEHNGELLNGMSPEEVYETALFLMMRLVFIFYAEENHLLPHGDVFYDQAYGLTHLWNRLEQQRMVDYDRFQYLEDAWPGLLATFRLIHRGCSHPDFAMVAYGGALFDPERFAILEDSRLRVKNEALWKILRRLTTAENKDGRQRVSYRALQVEQLGYVYENLLGYTVREAKEPMLLPTGGLEAFPVQTFIEALENDQLNKYFKTVTKLHWSHAKKLANEVINRAAENDEIGWVFEPIADEFIDPGQRYVAFQMGTRKRGGIFYTPPQLTSFLVEQALKPQCYDDHESETPRIKLPQHILSLTVCDPAMGSGAFLVQAVRYLADRLLEAWDAASAESNGMTLHMPYAQPINKSSEDYGPIPSDRAEALAWARRLVAERCIYGVDLNHLAVELAKLSLWLVTLGKDKPFTFLDHRLRHGNSLIGASFFAETKLEFKKRRAKEYDSVGAENTVRQISFIPNEALKAHKGASKQEKSIARDRIKISQRVIEAMVVGQITLFADMTVEQTLKRLVERKGQFSAPTRKAGDYDNKVHLLKQVVEQGDYPKLKEIADLWCAVWFWPRLQSASLHSDGGTEGGGLPPTTEEYHDCVYTILDMAPKDMFGNTNLSTQAARIEQIRRVAKEVAQREHFFHWELQFPAIFTRSNPGFDALCGNPPWETVKPNSQEFFETYDPNFRNYGKQDALRVVDALMEEDPAIAATWEQYNTSLESQGAYFNSKIAYHYQGRGDTNTYKLFAERFYQLQRIDGQYSVIVPSGIYTDLGSMQLRELMFENGTVRYIVCFSNEKFIFPGVHHAFKFTLLGFSRGERDERMPVAFRINPHEAITADQLPLFITNPDNLIQMPVQSIHRFSPDSLSIMEFRSQRDVDIATQIYADHPLLGDDVPDSWNVHFAREFDMTNDSHLFHTGGHGLPLYEGRMVDQFEHQSLSWVSGRGRTAIWTALPHNRVDSWQPQFCLSAESVLERQNELYGQSDFRLGFLAVAASTNTRTIAASMIPALAGMGHSLNAAYVPEHPKSHFVLSYALGIVNSFVFDFVTRFKIKLNVSPFLLKQVPVPRLQAGNPYFDALVPRAARLTCFSKEFADLWQEVMDTPWPDDQLVCPPPRSDDAEIESIRQRLRDEVDALVAHLYGLSRDDFEHILGTFPLVFKDNDAGQMKKETLLSVYDEFEGVVSDWSRE